MEEKFLSLLLDELHIYLFIAIVCIIYLLKSIKPVRELVWGTPEQPSKWKWLVTPMNVVLSSVGIFILNFTPFTTTNMKIVSVLVISAVATFAYELVIKHLEELVKNRFLKKKAISGG